MDYNGIVRIVRKKYARNIVVVFSHILKCLYIFNCQNSTYFISWSGAEELYCKTAKSLMFYSLKKTDGWRGGEP